MKTVTGLFDTYDAATSAVTQLERLGIPSSDISIVSNNAAHQHHDNTNTADGAGAGIGALAGGAGGLLTGLGIIAIPGVGPVVAAGWLAATLAGIAAGAVVGGAAGGVVGALTDSGVPEEDAHVYAEGVRRGGSLVTARVDDELAQRADDVLEHGERVVPSVRRASYAEGGWTRFDDTLDPYTQLKIDAENKRINS